jgi:hypothetical protein
VIMAWTEGAACKVQRLNSSGAAAFTAGGAATPGPTAASPYIAFDSASSSIYMSYVQGSSTMGVFAQKFDSTGTAQWGNGVQITPVAATPPTPEFVHASLTSNGFIATWFELVDMTNLVVRAAKVTSAGLLAWPSVLEVNPAPGSRFRLDTVSSPSGPTIAVYMDSSAVDASRINDDGTLGNPPPPACGTADFNCDGAIGTDSDIEAFFACLSGTCPPAPCTNNADFNADGAVGTDSDIESFFRVLSGGPC